MEQVIVGGYGDNLHATTTEYNALVGGRLWDSTEALRYQLVSADGVFKNLRVRLQNAPGAGKHFTFTLSLNGNPTLLTFDIANLDTLGSNMVNEVVVTAGDTVSLECDPDGTPTVGHAWWTCMFEGDTSAESLIMGGSQLALDNASTEYSWLMSGFGEYFAAENDARQVCPTAGIIKDLHVLLSEDPGTAPDAYRFTVRLNGVTVAQSLIVTITAPATTGSDLVHNLVVVAGDVLTMMIEPLNGPSATPYAHWGMTFVATIDGESIVLGGDDDSIHNENIEYIMTSSVWITGWTVNEAIRYHLGQVCTVTKLYILLDGSPGAGNTCRFFIRIAGADSNVVANVTGVATTGNSGALTDTVANDEYVDLKHQPISYPTVRDVYWGFVFYRQPGWSGKISGVTDPQEVMGVAKTAIAAVKGVA